MIVIIDYGLGNLGSLANMFKKFGAKTVVTSDPGEIARADKLVLPGVGSFDAGMRNLVERGLIEPLNERVLSAKVPILGICLGMQLLGRKSEEGTLGGLGWLEAEAVRFRFEGEQRGLKIPHMGWNRLRITGKSPLFEGLEQESRFYFVHSYHMVADREDVVMAETTYGFPFNSVIGKGNIIGVQFHPEKSHKYGMQMLKNFAEVGPG